MNNAIKFIIIIILTVTPVYFCIGQVITDNTSLKILNQTEALTGKAGFGITDQESIASIVAKVIQAFLGLLGIIFVVLIVIAGNKWMNARGNEEKVEEAQDTIRRAIIGLIITVSAYAITYFVFSNLPGGGGVG